jgi:hypothetical protein
MIPPAYDETFVYGYILVEADGAGDRRPATARSCTLNGPPETVSVQPAQHFGQWRLKLRQRRQHG